MRAERATITKRGIVTDCGAQVKGDKVTDFHIGGNDYSGADYTANAKLDIPADKCRGVDERDELSPPVTQGSTNAQFLSWIANGTDEPMLRLNHPSDISAKNREGYAKSV